MRLIDADEFIDWLDVGHLRSPSEVCYSEGDVKVMIDMQPTIEAVPVERNKVIDEFAEMCKADIMCQTFGLHPINIDKIAEQMKGGA